MIYHFEHFFIVCQNLKQPLLFGIGFCPTQCYKIGINWDHTGALYMWYKGRKLTSAWQSSAMSQCGMQESLIISLICTLHPTD